MPYVSLYRKYRPQTFEDCIGQGHVTRTLQNAIRQGKVSHAYLFCGTRGTGKTTTARLLAKALNCDKGPTPEPCNACPACIGITEGKAMDIIELDAASHRGIGDVKDINENVKFPPMELRYKVFIIDEAHQLSSDAKDAFLKTLEEPPQHTVFILATTEPQSIPITIRSRCQQFDFRRGSLRDIRGRLKFVAESEGVGIEDAALDLMAENAEGSWRDSLSLLEQVLAYSDGQVTLDDVNTVLGTVNLEFLFNLVDTLSQHDERGAFMAAAEAVESGKDIQQLLKSIAGHFRNLLFAQVSNDLSDLTTSEELAGRLRAQSQKFGRGALIRAVEVLTEAEKDIRFSDQHRLILELALLKTIEALNPSRQQAAPQVLETSQPPLAGRSLGEVGKEQPKPTPAPEPQKQSPPAKVEAEPAKQSLPDFDRIKGKWGQVLQHIKSRNPSAHGLLKDAVPIAVRNDALVLQFEGEGQKNLIEKETDRGGGPSKRQTLLWAIEQVFGVRNAKIICEVKPPEAPRPKAGGMFEEGDDLPDPFQETNDDLKNVLEMFPDAKIVDE